MQISNKRALTIVAGVSGSGKSTFALRYLLNAKLDARFVFDLGGEYASRLRMQAAKEPYDLAIALARGWVLFDPEVLFPGQIENGFAFFAEWAFTVSQTFPGRKLFIVDEAYRYQTTNGLPAELACCVFDGRKRGLDVMFNIQAPNKLNNTILNECTEFVSFRLQSGRATEIAGERGFNPEELTRLPDLHFISRSSSGGELRGRIKV
ncbi:MAG TPA: hypothetical protein VHH88_02870 [Verrucomicrobiae bacterium]|nr:hypothetical protein [Verrucomicrobiae bacterium]